MKATKELRDYVCLCGNRQGDCVTCNMRDDLDEALASAEAWKARAAEYRVCLTVAHRESVALQAQVNAANVRAARLRAAIAVAVERLSGNRPRSENEMTALSGLRVAIAALDEEAPT